MTTKPNTAELKPYLIQRSVERAEGVQVWRVMALDEKDALEAYHRDGGVFEYEEVEATDLGTPECLGETDPIAPPLPSDQVGADEREVKELRRELGKASVGSCSCKNGGGPNRQNHAYACRYRVINAAMEYIDKTQSAAALQSSRADVGEQKLVAYVPIHPRQGPLWANTVTSLDQDRPSYPVMKLYASPLAAQAVEQAGQELTPEDELFMLRCEREDQTTGITATIRNDRIEELENKLRK